MDCSSSWIGLDQAGGGSGPRSAQGELRFSADGAHGAHGANPSMQPVDLLMTFKRFLHRTAARVACRLPRALVVGTRMRRLRQAGLRFSLPSEPPYHSQYGQDRYVWENVFHGSHVQGVFVEIGAFDGVSFSNTVYFERQLQWSGVCVEPNPVAFEKLQQNRSATCLNVGIGTHLGELEFLQCSGWGGMLSCFKDFASDEHLARLEKEQREHDFQIQRVMVPVLPIRELLQQAAVSRIDLLSIDVEGAELEILLEFPFDTTLVNVVTVEVNTDALRLEELMWDRGFRLQAVIGTDHIYVNHGYAG
jgi:FkbM family methyltransferase